MVVGDVVAGVFDAATTMTFQPALSVEIVLTSISSYGNNCLLTDGAITSILSTGNSTSIDTTTSKVMINNTIYLTVNAASANGSSYSGIQIK